MIAAAIMFNLSLALLPPTSCVGVQEKAQELARMHAAGIRVGVNGDQWTSMIMGYLYAKPMAPDEAAAFAGMVCAAGGGPDLLRGFI